MELSLDHIHEGPRAHCGMCDEIARRRLRHIAETTLDVQLAVNIIDLLANGSCRCGGEQVL